MQLECDETYPRLLTKPTESFSNIISQIYLRAVSQNMSKMDEVPEILEQQIQQEQSAKSKEVKNYKLITLAVIPGKKINNLGDIKERAILNMDLSVTKCILLQQGNCTVGQ